MTSPQRFIKQTLIGTVYGIIVITIGFLIVITFFPKPPAAPIIDVPKAQALQVLRYDEIPLGDGYSDFWAEISNPNDDFGAKSLDYTFILKNSQGQIERKNGNTFVLPGDRKRYILLLNYSSDYTLQGFEVSTEPIWTPLSKFDLPALIVRNVSLGVSAKAGNAFTVFGILTNSSDFNLKNIQAIAILTDDKNNIIGVNETIVRDILTSESRDFEMTWNSSIPNASTSDTTIYTQSNVIDDRELLIKLQQGPLFDR